MAGLPRTAAKAPRACGRLLAARDFPRGRSVELGVISKPGVAQTTRLLEVVRARYLPNRLIAVAPSAGDGPATPLLADRRALDGKATAYLCEGFVCQAPTTDPAELAHQLDGFRAKPVAA